MKKELRDDYIGMRVTAEERKLIEDSASANGFHSITQYIIWLVKKFGKKE